MNNEPSLSLRKCHSVFFSNQINLKIIFQGIELRMVKNDYENFQT